MGRRKEPRVAADTFWGYFFLFVQTQELEALLLTVLHLPPRCGINRQSASCIAHIFKALYLATETLQFQTWMEDNTHRAHSVQISKRAQNYTRQDISVQLPCYSLYYWGNRCSTSIRNRGFILLHNVRLSYGKPQPRGYPQVLSLGMKRPRCKNDPFLVQSSGMHVTVDLYTYS